MKFIESYCPFHNLPSLSSSPQTSSPLPPILFNLSLHDQRVPFHETYQYIQNLRQLYKDDDSILCQISDSAGNKFINYHFCCLFYELDHSHMSGSGLEDFVVDSSVALEFYNQACQKTS